MYKKVVLAILGVLFLAGVCVFTWLLVGGSEAADKDLAENVGVPAGAEQIDDDPSEGGSAGSSMASQQSETAQGQEAQAAHPLLGKADAVVLAEGSDQIDATAAPEIAHVIETVAQQQSDRSELAPLTIDYPQNETIFPQELVPPTFLWHEPTDSADTWLIELAFKDDEKPVYILSPGRPPPMGDIDPECISKTNEIYQPTAYQASAKSWTPERDVWTVFKERSLGQEATVTILGFDNTDPPETLSRGQITMTTSEDPVDAPIFYRDVPLAPSQTEEGVIKPLDDSVVTLISWRLRDISQPESRLLLTDVPRCTNCHSFSADGKTMGMDLDGPQTGKGGYIVAPTEEHLKVDQEEVINWNDLEGMPEDQETIGFLSQISPNGEYAITTVNEEVYVCNFLNYKFLQVFYPTRGMLAYYSRETEKIKLLPGADDPEYVHCDGVWSPDGEYLVFARAKAMDAYPEHGKLAKKANGPLERQIQYDLYRMPFNDGRGGTPEPITGASDNGMSNTFPKVSPDGKWIVFVKCRNGQLMRPDSELWIVPAEGGTARRMRCNTSLMNSWHSFSPNGRWMVFSSKANTPYTQMFLTHIDEEGNDSPPVLVPNATAANRAVNIPEFVNLSYDGLKKITMPAIDYRKYLVRGKVMAERGELDQAVAEYNMAFKIKSDCMEARVNAAVICIQQGLLEEATSRLKKALKIDPSYSPAHVSMGVVLGKQGKLSQAIVHFDKALKLAPDNASAHTNLAKAMQARGMLDRATEHFQAALELDEEDPTSHFLLANALLAQGAVGDAIQHLETAVELDPQFVNGRLILGKALVRQGSFAAAITQFEEAVAISPDNLTAVNSLAWLLATCSKDELRDGARALQLVKPACASTGDRDPILLSTLAAAHAETGNFSKAAETATKALQHVTLRQKWLAQRIRYQLSRYMAGQSFQDLSAGPRS